LIPEKNLSKEKTHVKGFSPEAMEMMKSYSWPGNIRELKNFVESVIVLQKGEVINSYHVRKQLGLDNYEDHYSPNLPVKVSKTVDQAERELMLKQLFLLRKDVNDIKEAIFGSQNFDMLALPQNSDIDFDRMVKPKRQTPVFRQNIHHDDDFQEHDDDAIINISKIGELSMADMERTLIEETLKKFGFKKRKTAQALEISERTLYRKIKEYGLQE